MALGSALDGPANGLDGPMVGAWAKGARPTLIAIRTVRDLIRRAPCREGSLSMLVATRAPKFAARSNLKDLARAQMRLPSILVGSPRRREPKIRRRRLISAFAGQGAVFWQNRPWRPFASALTHSIVGGLWATGTQDGSRRLPGGAEGIRTPDLCSAIAALSHLSYSPVARVFTCASDLCQRGQRRGSGLLRFKERPLKAWENSCARSSTS